MQMVVNEIKNMSIEELIKVLEGYPKDRQVKVYYDANGTGAIQIDVPNTITEPEDETFIDGDGIIHFR